METGAKFYKAAEKVTKAKLHAIVLKMVVAKNVLSKFVRRANEQQDPSEQTLESILWENAVIRGLEREVNEVLRDHEIFCGCCRKKHKLREVAASGIIPEFVLLCPVGFYHKGDVLGELELESLKEILKFATCNPKEIFYTKD